MSPQPCGTGTAGTGWDKAFILGVGMMTPVGLTALQTARSIRAGLSRVEIVENIPVEGNSCRLSRLPEEVMKPLEAERLPDPSLQPYVRRLLQLAVEPLQAAAGVLSDPPPLPLFLALPAPLSAAPSLEARSFLSSLAVLAGISLDLKACCAVELGRSGFFYALDLAIKSLGKTGLALCGGVDSLVDRRLLEHYGLQEKRLMVQDAQDGFVPGEGGAFLLLGSPDYCTSRGLLPLAVIRQPGLGEEEGHLYSDQPCLGTGLSQALGALFERSPAEPVRTVMAGFNGEHFWAKEWGASQVRHSQRLAPELRMLHPAETLGDAGAALPALLTAYAALELQHQRMEAPVLVFASSDHAPRGATLLEPVTP